MLLLPLFHVVLNLPVHKAPHPLGPAEIVGFRWERLNDFRGRRHGLVAPGMELVAGNGYERETDI